MSEKFEPNGDYYAENFKRKSGAEPGTNGTEDNAETEENIVIQKASEYVRELLAEKLLIDQNKLPNAARLLEQEVAKTQSLGRAPVKENKYVDIYREKPIKVTVKVLVPVREHPKFNFVGKLLGPKGNSMKRLQDETMCKMAVLGKGSMKDRAKEEELRNSLDPKYSHLSDDLHVEISALGPPAEAHARVAFALAEVRKYLIPDNNDNIRQEQMREMELFGERGNALDDRDTRLRRSAPSIPRPSIPRPLPPAMRTVTRVPVTTPRVMPAKTKIMSILDRARVAMEESYGYEDDYGSTSPGYSSFSSSRAPYTSGYYDDYETDYYKGSTSGFDYHRREHFNPIWQNKPKTPKQSNWYSSPSKKVG
ncbi:KH domain-containing, RNA-binding, signal transduction-associated protein 2-like isoform X2 [Diorhabda carinulata]|uniref:KH domain-containing, RNA-binding, signal transduction-associated protein 2-like isoform X2 n=1 Tax=Diorhabda sublineata TaxID=1163346 RepID=UPI0024E0B052|nr:KH domain-containing, RNA-binding, signal transduction-associated protein 2-like isoform X2 [Diorhabda sublineata]XP_057660925.1 KH domain-containing, RNA-binding, signal transduction-associated protein 2-like isoform X2 [Diorhabda carinulata]